MSDGIERLGAIRILGQRAIEELGAIKDRCAQYAEDLRIAQDKLRDSEAGRERLTHDRDTWKELAEAQGGRIHDLNAERDRLARELAEARKIITDEQSTLVARYATAFPNYAYVDPVSAIDLMAAEIFTLRKELEDAYAARTGGQDA